MKRRPKYIDPLRGVASAVARDHKAWEKRRGIRPTTAADAIRMAFVNKKEAV